MADETRPFRELITQITGDGGLQTSVLALNQRYQLTTEVVADVGQLDDGDFAYNSVADIILTSINGQQGLPEQKVRVEYLRADQKLVIPGALGMTWRVSADAEKLAPTNNQLRGRYRKLAGMTYAALCDAINEASSPADLRTTIEALTPANLTERFTGWDTDEWLTIDNEVDRNMADVRFTIVSKALQFNCDVRDYGYLLADGATVKDDDWMSVNDVAGTRLSIKLKPYSLHMIAALNLPACADYELGGWIRAYGLAFGIYPSRGTRSMAESVFTTRMPISAQVEAVRRFEHSYEDLMIPICANILAMFGLLHLNKDHTYRTGDENMDRIGTSYINTLRTSATAAMLESIMARKEVVLRTAPHPFGLAQTYWLAKALHRFGMLMPALDIRHDTTPPPVQRLMIVDAAAREWNGMPVGAEISEVYRDKLSAIANAIAEIKVRPPLYSDLYRLYGLDAKMVVNPELKNAVESLMPIAYGFAMATHVSDSRTKDGIALAQSLMNVEREMKGQAVAWKAAWEAYMEKLDKFGIETFLSSYREAGSQ